MKLLVFAHTPPPHHGQSYMVQLMLEGFGGDVRRQPAGAASPQGIECYHVNARFSKSLEDVGEFQGAKIFLILYYCLQAIWLRFRYGVENFYYVPAPGKRVALYRDWLVMLLCRPFFKKMILHWHAAGLAKWLETSANISSRVATYKLFWPVDLSIVLSGHNFADGEKLLSRQIRIVHNGIADSCPDFASTLWPRHQARTAARRKLLAGDHLEPAEAAAAGGDPHLFKVLYLAHCMREKGVFDAIEGVVEANARLRRTKSPLRLELTIAGEFVNPGERLEFDRRLAELASEPAPHTRVTYLGFVAGDRKTRAFAASDCFCFPTYYHAESFGLVAVEAMAFGLPVITTRWRSLPEILPSGYSGLVPIRSPGEIAGALLNLTTAEASQVLRQHFLDHFTLASHFKNLAAAIRSVE